MVKMNLFFNVLAVTLVLLFHGEISRYILFSVDSVVIHLIDLSYCWGNDQLTLFTEIDDQWNTF